MFRLPLLRKLILAYRKLPFIHTQSCRKPIFLELITANSPDYMIAHGLTYFQCPSPYWHIHNIVTVLVYCGHWWPICPDESQAPIHISQVVF